MENSIPPTAKRQIRNLLGVLFAGVFAAVVFALFMLHNYNPTGRYLLKNVLLSPQMTSLLAYDDINPKTGSQTRFVFDQIEFAIWNSDKKDWKKIRVNTEQYKQFYESIQDDTSILDVKDDVVNLFYKSNPLILTLSVKSESGGDMTKATKTFQTVQFVNEGDYYRVELREQGNTEGWAYFYHPGIYAETSKLQAPRALSP